MSRTAFLLLVGSMSIVQSALIQNEADQFLPEENSDNQPLYLTPFIERGFVVKARKLSEVNHPAFLGVKSYSGFLTISKKFNSNLFFWFFPAQVDYENAPVLVWLQGGPGATSLFGLFTEIGPFEFGNGNLSLNRREYSWSREHSVLYIDNPVGTGFSFTDHDGYSQNDKQIGEGLYIALQQFFKLFHELQKNDFYITGESYAGKYIPSVAYAIHRGNPTAPFKINLQGLSIGNGLSDPVNQMVYGDYLYQIGLIDKAGLKQFHDSERVITTNIKKGKYAEAFEGFDAMLNKDFSPYPTLFFNHTGLKDYYNYLNLARNNTDMKHVRTFVDYPHIRIALHVGSVTFDTDPRVERTLVPTFMKSVAPWISELLSHYRLLLYNGQLDIIVPYPATENYLDKLKFKGDNVYRTARRKQWWVNNQLAGYIKEAGNLTFVLVRNAGHMAPTDQPELVYDLIHKFVRNQRL